MGKTVSGEKNLFGEYLKARRKFLGKIIVEVARQSGYSREQIIRFEAKGTLPWNEKRRERYAQALGLTMSQLKQAQVEVLLNSPRDPDNILPLVKMAIEIGFQSLSLREVQVLLSLQNVMPVPLNKESITALLNQLVAHP